DRDRMGAPVDLLDLGAGAVQTILSAGQQPDMGARLREGARGRAADAGGGAGDDDDLVRQICSHARRSTPVTAGQSRTGSALQRRLSAKTAPSAASPAVSQAT